MIAISFRSIIFGTCLITAQRGFDDIFLSECKNRKIELKNLFIDKEFFTFEISYTDKELLMQCAAIAAVNIQEIKYKGIPHLIFRYRRRFGIPVGLAASFLIIGFLSSMLWSIDYSGNSKITDDVLAEVLVNYGVTPGVFVKCIDSEDLEFYLSEKFKEFSRVSVHIAGSRMFITIKEREQIEDIEPDNTYSNIVAAKNGEIIRADIYEGDGKIEKGTAVVKGDLLVSGIINFRDGRVRFTDAKADIWAYTENHINVISATDISVFVPSDIRNKYSLLFFGLCLPRKNYENFYSINNYFFDAGSVVFPIGIVRTFFCDLNKCEKKLSPSEALLISFSDYAVSVMKLKKNAEIIDKEENVIIDKTVGFESEFKCRENIATKKIFTVEDTE